MFSFVFLVILTATAEPLPAAALAELKALAGNWQIVQYAGEGVEREADEDDPILEFRGRFLLIGPHLRAFVAAVDPGTNPKCIDFRSLERGQSFRVEEGVYKLDRDTLTIVLRMEGETNRPTDLGVPREKGIVRAALQRVKN